jgi:chemotaxis protein methyltransferase CheR
MSAPDSALVAELCAERAGLSVDPDKPYVVETRLAPLARRERFDSVADLVEALRSDPEDRLVWGVVEAMVSPETGFFRDGEVLERLWREEVPAIARRRPDGVVRIWSAGCAAGQEIYSLAIMQADEPAPTGRVELFASDLSERLLTRAQSGIYSSFEVQRGLSARRLVRHFENRGDRFQLARDLREQVRWRRVNLLDDLSPLGRFDVVLCRHVLGGLVASAGSRVLQALRALTAPDGLLVLGAGEGAPGATVYEPAPPAAAGEVRAAA